MIIKKYNTKLKNLKEVNDISSDNDFIQKVLITYTYNKFLIKAKAALLGRGR